MRKVNTNGKINRKKKELELAGEKFSLHDICWQ